MPLTSFTVSSISQTLHINSVTLEPMKNLLSLLVLLLLTLTQAQTVITYWHSQDATEDLIQSFADEFNASQDQYEVVPEYAGNYQESWIKLAAALGTPKAPAIFDAEITVFPRLVEEGGAADLSDLTATLAEDLVAEIFPALWDYGEFDGVRYGLPWNMSMPTLFYNASVFEKLGVEPPTTWEAFEEAADRLTTRNTRGYIDVAAPITFETLVASRGGSLITEDGQPNFDSPEAVDALSMLQRMAKARNSIPRGATELDQALVDFARTKAMMAIASEALFPQGERFSVAFDIAAAPIPSGGSQVVPLTGAQFTVLAGASAEQQQGAFAFWQYLMQPEMQVRWVQESYFLPVRRSVVDLLEDWYAESPNRGVALSQLEYAVNRPRVGAYVVWQSYLAEALERATKGRGDPAEVLQEAQRRALESR